jgi:hypothetical protein
MNSFIPKICQDCNNKQFGAIDCCTSPFINYPGFLITLPDINRILKNTCYKIEDFAKIIKVEGDDLKEDNDNYLKIWVLTIILFICMELKMPFQKKGRRHHL